ncbi:MAG: hypothetical protein K2F92_07845 [Alistipes sp.]|nr:hypothetical protein [Alistipes sp.]
MGMLRREYIVRAGAAILFCCAIRVVAAQKIGIAYCDVDHLYDTVPALFYDDSDYTPQGRLKWNSERYRRKIAQVAALADSLTLPIVALWGVENEAVVRDISAACRNDYSYLHRTLNSLDGMDFALLYFPDIFAPHYVEPGRRYLYVEGTLRRPAGRGHPRNRVRVDTLGLLLCSETRMARWVAADLREERPGARLVALGRLPAEGLESCGLRDAHARQEHLGRGNIRSNGGWRMRDRAAVDTAWRIDRGEIYIRRFLLDAAAIQPLATYDRRRYRGGTSYALPVYVYLE